MLDFEVGSNKIKLSNQNGDLRFREMVWVWIPPIWRAVLSLFYPPVIIRGKNGKNSENPVGSNKSEKRKPKSAVYRSFWASVVYFHLRLISTKSHKREMTRNQFGSNPTRVRIPPAAPKRKTWPTGHVFLFGLHRPGQLHSALTCCGLFVKMVLENRRGMSEYKLFCEEAYASQYKVSSERINRIVAHTQINSLFQQIVVI